MSGGNCGRERKPAENTLAFFLFLWFAKNKIKFAQVDIKCKDRNNLLFSDFFACILSAPLYFFQREPIFRVLIFSV